MFMKMGCVAEFIVSLSKWKVLTSFFVLSFISLLTVYIVEGFAHNEAGLLTTTTFRTTTQASQDGRNLPSLPTVLPTVTSSAEEKATTLMTMINRFPLVSSDFRGILTSGENMVTPNPTAAKYEEKLEKVKSEYMKDIFSAMLVLDDEASSEALVNNDQHKTGTPTVRVFMQRSVEHFGYGTSVLTFNMSVKQEYRPISRLELVVDHSKENLENLHELHSFHVSFCDDSSKDEEEVTITPTVFDKYVIFDISCYSDYLRWAILNKTTETLHVTIKDQATKHSASILNGTAIELVMYNDLTRNPLTHLSEHRSRRNAGEEEGDPSVQFFFNRARHVTYSSSDLEKISTDSAVLCQRYSWILNLTYLGFDWFIAPRIFNAGVCKGDCVFPFTVYTNHTNYSFIKNLFHYRSFLLNDHVPRAHCTPVKLLPQSIIFLSEQGEPTLMQIKDMRVGTCGCR